MITTAAIKETTAAKLLVEYLKQEGVEYVFGIPGAPLMPFYEALYETGWIKPILAKHEEGAAFMADGYARVSGKLGVCCATTGPGATNLITGVACAYADSIPMLVLTAQVATTAFGKGAVQESTYHGVDIVDMFKAVSKSSIMLPSPEKMGDVLRASLRMALSGRKGPVHINLPADFMKKAISASMVTPEQYRVTAHQFDRNAIKEASNQLMHARRPVILAGNGVNLSGGQEELRRLSERLNIPVATSPKAKGAFPENHIYSMGVFGFGASLQAEKYLLSGEVDVLLAVGTSLGESVTCGWDSKLTPSKALIQIDIDPGEIGKNYPTTHGILGDAKAALRELNYQVERDSRWIAKIATMDSKWAEGFKTSVPRFANPEKMISDAVPLKPQRVMTELRNALPSDAIVFVDIGTAMFWAVQYFPIYEPGTFYLNLGMGSMGHAVAGCIGGKLARPDRPVVAIVGDGAFAMNGMEIHTAAELDLPVIWVVINNGGLGLVYHGERIVLGRKSPNGIYKHDIKAAEIGRSLGAEAFTVTRPGELANHIKTALRSRRPCVIDVTVDRDEAPSVGDRVKVMNKALPTEYK